MKITILCVGKIREKFYREAVAEYAKRLGRYCKLAIVEVADEKTPDGAGAALEEQIREREAERLFSHLSKYRRAGAFICALAIDGEMLDSVELSERIRQLGIRGTSHIVFLIGGSLGMPERLLREADVRLSFSRMTFPHPLMRVILLEQLYRACRIANGEPYHK